MPAHRIATIYPSKAATTAATVTEPINIKKPISQIIIEFKGTNNGATPTAHGAKMISKIEIINGSDVLYSLSGIQSQAMSAYQEKRLPFAVNEYRNDVMNIQCFNINFGRYLWDDLLALDPARFDDLQIAVTHNKANGGSAPDVGNLRIFAQVFDERQINPTGFLMSKQKKAYALVNSTHEYITLPRDHPMRSILIQSLAVDKQPWEQYNKVKLNIDGGERVPINDLSTSDLLKLLRPIEPFTEEICGTGTGSGVQHFVTPTYETYVTTLAFDAAVTTSYCNQSYGGDATIAHDNAEHFQGHVIGLAPHGAIEIPLGVNDLIETWFDPNQGVEKDWELDLTAGSSIGSSSTCEILTQQFRRY